MLEEGQFAIYEVKERFRPIKCKTPDDAVFVFIACSFFYFIQNYALPDPDRRTVDRLEE